MADDIEERIRARAYELWDQAGRPHDRSVEFWIAARQQLEGEPPHPGDRPGEEVDFPPDERTVEDPPNVSVAVDTGVPGEIPAADPVAEIAVPQVHPGEPEAAEATVPHDNDDAPEPKTRAAQAVATSAARKVADADEAAAPSRRPRTGAARPPASRPAPSPPNRK